MKTQIAHVGEFLILNGFEKIEKNSFTNDLCNVTIEKDHYAVADNQGNTMYSDNLKIYWLIGILTYFRFIGKNYNQANEEDGSFI